MTEPQTKIDAYTHLKKTNEDVSLRKRVAATLAREPGTIKETIARFDERGPNSIRPRISELVAMGILERDGTTTNPGSGNEAYIHHITERGERYLRGEIDPDPPDSLAKIRRKAVDAARDYLRGDIGEFELQAVVEHHDRVKKRMDPNWQDGLE